MKKSLLLIATMVMSSGAFAQWAKPVPTNTQEIDLSGDSEVSQYLFNVGACGFFAGANNWNTRTSIATYADPVRFEVYDGDMLIFNCYPTVRHDEFTSQPWRYVSANDDGSMWIDAPSYEDGNNYQGGAYWMVTKDGDYYTIFNQHAADKYGGGNLAKIDIVNGASGDTRLYLYNPDARRTHEVDGEKVDDGPMYEGNVYDQWVFIDQEEYERLQPMVEPYLVSEKLRAAIDNAKLVDEAKDFSRFEEIYKAAVPVEDMNAAIDNVNAYKAVKNALVEGEKTHKDLVDLSPVYAVYNNADATTEELQAAEKQVTAIIGKYEATKATFDSPIEVEIGNGSSFTPWSREFTGTGTTGDPATNTWSSEADNGADGTDMTTPFCQVWTGSGGILSDQKIYQSYFASPGLYKLTINARAYSEAGGIDTFKGLTMFFGDDVINIQEQTPMFKSGNKCVLWKDGGFTIVSVVKEAGELEFGFEVKDANWNWIAFKNTSLTYYGNENADENAVLLMKDAYNFSKVDADEVDAQPALIEAYNKAVDAIDAAKTPEDLKAAAKEASAAKEALDANAKAYTTLLETFITWDIAISEKTGLEGDEWNAFCDFMQSEEPLEGYPSPNPMVINAGDRSLSTEEIEQYIKDVEALYTLAVAHSITQGADCTDMLVNASFQEGFKGWTDSKGKELNPSINKYGGKDFCKDVEVYEGVVDIMQIIKEVPNGIYSLECQAFERPSGNGSYNGEEAPKVFLYMNSFQTPVMNICKDAVAPEDVANLNNCYIAAEEEATEGTGAWPYDYNVSGIGWVPNSVDGASYAFRAGRYTQKVYGLIENNEMKIGLTSNGKSAHWVNWANFKLTFEGNSAEAIGMILPTFTDQLEDYVFANQDNMSEPVTTMAAGIIDDARKADGDAEAMSKALSAVNTMLQDAKDNVSAYQNLVTSENSVSSKVDVAMMTYGELASEEAQSAWLEWTSEVENALYMTTDELNACAAEGLKVAGILRLSVALADVDLSVASAENPVDATAAIENPSFEEGLNGWDVVRGGDTGAKEISNATYTIAWDEEVAEAAGNYVFNTWAGSIPADGLPASQAIYGLPAGTYTLSAYLASDKGNKVVLYANDKSTEVTMAGDKTTPNLASLTFTLTEEDPALTIKVNGVKCWYKADVFTLTYLGADPTAIENVTTAKDAAATVAIYNTAGVRISKLQKGINIVKMSNGKTKKVLVK